MLVTECIYLFILKHKTSGLDLHLKIGRYLFNNKLLGAGSVLNSVFKPFYKQ